MHNPLPSPGAWVCHAIAGAALVLSALSASADDAGIDTGDALDFERMTLTFDEPFDTLDVSAWGPGTRWIAHTPWSGDFGGARFSNPKSGFPFTLHDGVLRIEARQTSTGVWASGLLASVDTKGRGFKQKYGYFEMRARLPLGDGVWPAFWLIGIDRSKFTAEVDVIEYYGYKPDGYSASVHIWHRDGRHYSDFDRIKVFPQNNPEEFNTYGVKVDAQYIRMYFNRKLMWKTRTPAESRQPMFMLLNLALKENTRTFPVPNPSFMYVDYVKAFRLDQTAVPVQVRK